MGTERSAREVAGDMPRETFEKAVEAAAKAVCAHRSYRMIAAEVLASVNHAGAVDERDRWKALADAALDAVPQDHPDLGVWLVEYADLGGQQERS